MHKVNLDESGSSEKPMSATYQKSYKKKPPSHEGVALIGLNTITRQSSYSRSESSRTLSHIEAKTKTSARGLSKELHLKNIEIPKLIIPLNSEREESVTGETPQKRVKKNIANADEHFMRLKNKLQKEATRPVRTEKRAGQLLNEYKELQVQLSQGFITIGIIPPQVHFSDKLFFSGVPIEFFLGFIGPFPEPLLQKINTELNKRVVLDLTQDLHHRNNKQIIISFIGKELAYRLMDQLSTANKNNDLTAQLQQKLLILWEFKEAVYQSIYVKKDHAVLKDISRIIGEIDQKGVLMETISHAVESRYLFSQLRLELRKTAQSLINESKQIPVTSYKLFKKRVYKNLSKDKVSYTDWIRAIRWTTILDSNDIPLIDPFQDKPDESEESTERRINDWVLKIMMKISGGLFQDEKFLLEFFGILQDAVKKISPDGYIEDFSLQAHQVLFQKLTESDETTTKQIFAELQKGLSQKKPDCLWDAKTIIRYLLYFYRAPLQQLVWGATGALRHVFNAIFTKPENLMNLADHWEEDKAQQIIIKFSNTEIQFTFLKRGSIIDEKTFWQQHLQILIPYPGGKALKNPVHANFYYKYPDNDESYEKKIKSFIKKLSFVVRAWGFPVLRRDRTEETNIKVLIKEAITRLKFPFIDYVHPDRASVQHHTIQWLRMFSILSDAQLEKIEDENFGYFFANAYPLAHLDTLHIIVDWATKLFVYDDWIEKMHLPKEVKNTHTMLLSILKGSLTDLPEITITANIVLTEFEKFRNGLMNAVYNLKKRIDGLLELLTVDIYWKTRFIQDVENYCNATLWESENRFDNIIPSLGEYFKQRPQTSGTLIMFDFIELAKNISIPQEIFNSSYFSSVRLIAANLVNWENDIQSAEKEIIRDEDVHNVIAILHHQFDISYPEAFDRAVELYNHGVKKFEEYKNNIPQDLGIHRPAIKKYIEGLTEWISAHHFWAAESTRYHGSFILPDSKYPFSKDTKKMNSSTLSYVGIQQLIEAYKIDVDNINDIENSRSFNKIGYHIIMTYQGWIGSVSKNVSHAKIQLLETLQKNWNTEEKISEELARELLFTIVQEIDRSLSGTMHPLPWALIGLLKQINQKFRSVFSLSEQDDKISKKTTSAFLLFTLLKPQIFKDIALRIPHIDLFMLDRVFLIMNKYYMNLEDLPKELTQLYGH